MTATPRLAIVITGPTASGKSALAIEVAKHFDTEIISADSRQIYHGIPIATAMPTDEQRAAVTHHLIDMLPLDAYYSASAFEENALPIARRLIENNGVSVICGGSMMYVDAFCHGIDFMPTVSAETRQRLETEWRQYGNEWLLEELKRSDPAFLSKVDPLNLKRVFHAIEVSREGGKPYSSYLTGTRCRREFDILKICLDGRRELLFERINRRVLDMVEAGLLREAESVVHMRHLNSLNTVGIKEMFAYLDGEMGFEDAVARMQKNTRVYAKKQLTWFKRDTDVIRLDIESDNICEKIIRLAEERLSMSEYQTRQSQKS